ncbi:MAG: S1 RNA-binding domain-containing protein [Candidatus Eisenbacteria bacterium]|nr:S1 RNA-binding domain-containing protein [Candidatus Latescibacterota bacterium]MBD3302078.1 S1 RNA-binding domain-containing protein [Candidatus Eisenbacteria bacterium]
MFETDPGNNQEPTPQPAGSPPSQDEETFRNAMSRGDTVTPTPEVGEKVRGKILSIGDEDCFVDFGGRSEATIAIAALRNSDGEMTASVGDEIEAYVVSNDDGVVLDTSFTAPPSEALEKLREAHTAELPVTGKVTGVNPGGIEVDLSGVRAFCPISQIDIGFTPDPSSYVGKSVDFRILEFGEGGRRIVVSRKMLLQKKKEEEAARIRESLHVGEVRDGTVVRMESFGAFVDLGGIDGMVHVSEISHDRVRQPSDVLKVGQTVRVQVLEIGKDAKGRDRISLSIKATRQDPWIDVAHQLEVGSVVTGTVVRLTDFGAFVRLLPGVEGLLHVSEIRDERVDHPRDALKEDETVEVRVLGIDTRRRRISLSMRTPGATGGKAKVGAKTEGEIRAHKPYGIFIDLPAFGPRVSGLLPLEETGLPRGADLSEKYPSGQKMEVMIQQIDEKGRIRLAMPTAQGSGLNLGNRGATSAMADALRRAMEEDGPDS